MSKTIASGVGLTNAWLAVQGRLSIKTLWAELAPLRRTAPCWSGKWADPHARWCGEAGQQWPPLPDSTETLSNSIWGATAVEDCDNVNDRFLTL